VEVHGGESLEPAPGLIGGSSPLRGGDSIKAVWNGVVLADSDETIVVEGNHYFPPESVDFSHLESSWMRSLCFWKGLASYYTAVAGGERNRNAAWTYHHPLPWIRKIRDHLAFWAGVEIRE
jgi:uncharacterized protein (DUF427 family)